MRTVVTAFVWLVSAIACAPAYAECSGVGDTCRTVVGSIDELRGKDTSNNDAFAKISVTCYHQADPDVVCAGGGDFDRVKFVHLVAPCDKGGLDNAAPLIQDAGKNCFYHKNFGLNGVVDARQCGVWGDGVESHTVNINGTDVIYYDVDLLNNCLQVAANETFPGLPNAISADLSPISHPVRELSPNTV